jgi:hypothetical protein
MFAVIRRASSRVTNFGKMSGVLPLCIAIPVTFLVRARKIAAVARTRL